MRLPSRRSHTLVRWLLVLCLVGVLQPAARGPVYAYEGEHYIWTYYLALHVGYTKRQAYQIASAAYAVDWDPDTGPMEAQPLDVLWGAEHPGLWTLQGMPSTKVAGIWRRFHAFADVTHCVITQQEQDLLTWLNPDAQLRAWYASRVGRIPIKLPGSPIFEIQPPPLPAIVGDIFRVLPLCGPDDLAGIAASRARARDELWTLARAQRNPGPLIHFVQDTYAHGDFTAVRGHALIGHVPDFLGSDSAKALAMTRDTIAVLQQFMREVLGQTPKDPDMRVIQAALSSLEGVNPAPDGSSLWFNWATWDPGVSPSLTSALQKVSVMQGSPSLPASIGVVRQLIANDEREGRLPAPFPDAIDIGVPGGLAQSTFVDAAAPADWMPFRFNLGGYVVPTVTVGGRSVEPRYEVERIEMAFEPPEVSHRALGRDRVRATFRFPYRVANAAALTSKGGSYISPLPVLEAIRETSGDGLPRQRLERREDGLHVIETTIDRDVDDFERAIVWDVVVHPYGLTPIRQQVPVRVNTTCDVMPQVAPDLERLREIAGAAAAAAAERRSLRSRIIDGVLPEVAREGAAAEAYLHQVEAAHDGLRATCRAASYAESQARQYRDQLDALGNQSTLLRSTADNLTGLTCEIAARAAGASAEGRANLAANAEGFARQAQAKAGEAAGLVTEARQVRAQLETLIQQSRLRELVEQDANREKAIQWLGETVEKLREKVAAAEAEVAGLVDPRVESDRLASGIATRLNTCLRTPAVRAAEEEAARLSASVRDVMAAEDAGLDDVAPIADWTRQKIDALHAAITASRIQQPACLGASMLMARIEPKPRELEAAIETIDLFARSAGDAASKAAACARDAARTGPSASTRPALRGPGVYRIVQTRVEPQLIGAPPELTKVFEGLQTSFEVAATSGAARGAITVGVPAAMTLDDAITVTADGKAQWSLQNQVFQWLAVNVNAVGVGENKTTGQEMHPPGGYAASASVAVPTTLAKSGYAWESEGRRYRELRVGFGVTLADYGILIKFIYVEDK